VLLHTTNTHKSLTLQKWVRCFGCLLCAWLVVPVFAATDHKTVQYLPPNHQYQGFCHHYIGWKPVQKLKFTTNTWVHLQSDILVGQLAQILLRLREVQSPVNQSNYFTKLALSYCKNRWLVATLSPQRLGFIPRPDSKWIKWQQDWFFSGYFGFPLFVSLHQCSTLIHLLLTPCGLSNCQCSPFGTRIICLVWCATHRNLNGGSLMKAMTVHGLHTTFSILSITLHDGYIWH